MACRSSGQKPTPTPPLATSQWPERARSASLMRVASALLAGAPIEGPSREETPKPGIRRQIRARVHRAKAVLQIGGRERLCQRPFAQTLCGFCCHSTEEAEFHLLGAHFVISMSLVLVQWSNATTLLPSSKTRKRRGCSGGQANSFDERVYIPASRRSYCLPVNPRRTLFEYFYVTNYFSFCLRSVPCKESRGQSGLVCDPKGNGSSGFSGLLHIRA